MLNYFVLTGYDTLATCYIEHPLQYSKIAITSFIGYAFSNNIGLFPLVDGTLRYRFYSAWRFTSIEITKIVAFCGVTLWLGFFTIAGIAFVGEPMAVSAALHLPFALVRPVGILFLTLIVMYLFWINFKKTPIKIWNWEFNIPKLKLSLFQIIIASFDWALAGSVLYVLLPYSPNISYLGFLGIFLLAKIAGLLSQIPGGIGVFETVNLLLLSHNLSAGTVMASLLAYRIIYYLLPLAIAAILLGINELLQRKKGIAQIANIFMQWTPMLMPQILAFTIFISGAILILSGAIPEGKTRLAHLRDLLPLPVIEISHFMGSLVGVALLILARGLRRRLDAAYHLTLILLGAGVVLSLLRGLKYEEAIVLAVMFGILLSSHRYFYRKASLLSQRFSPAWTAAVILVLLCSIWLGMFSYKHIEYSNELWWRFSLDENAPRFLRATVGAISLALFFAIMMLLRPAPPKPYSPSKEDLDKARSVLKESLRAGDNIVLLGDKQLLFSPSGKTFIMYGIQGKSWIALNDPIGEEREKAELVWQFREMCDLYDGLPVFFDVGQKNFPLYLELGLSFIKIGEEGKVSLESFSLEGGASSKLRYINRKLEKEGCEFSVIPPEEVVPLLPELKIISDNWLENKNTREKRFSLGYFNEEYLKNFPAGIVKVGEKIVAFADIWSGANKYEISPDLMRYSSEAPKDVMTYLFLQLILWAKKEGYKWFSLGMAPLSGIESRPLAPLWNQIGAFIFRQGENFYNFQGLRQYKEKFNPVWEPRYIAFPGGFSLPRILIDIAAIGSGGIKGIISK